MSAEERIEKTKISEHLNNPASRRQWWLSLENQWQMAFNQTVLNKGEILDLPTDEELIRILTTPVLRVAGKTAPYPNISFEVTNLSGVKELVHLEHLFVLFNQVESIDGNLEKTSKLQSLFLNNNRLQSLDGIEQLKALTQLYVNVNQIQSIEPVKKLKNLKTFYCNYNQLESLEGIGKKHRATLREFFCLPNDGISLKEIKRVEKLGIRCSKG